MPRGGYRGGRGRGFTLSPGASTLDRRPTKILVSGYELDDKDELLAHFGKFGEIVETIEDEATPSVILRFKNRKMAEGAMLGGKMYGDRVLQLSWFSGATPGREPQTEEEEVQEEPEDDGYIPPADDYLPPGLQEHEDSLSQGSQEPEDNEAEESDGGDEKEGVVKTGEEAENGDAEPEEELNEDLLLPDADEEEEEEEERSWKRNLRSTDED